MILGGGPNQIKFIETAHALGYYIVLCDFKEDNLGISYADSFHKISIIDTDAVYEAAVREEIDGIFTTSEPGMFTCSYVATKLNLPMIDYDALIVLANKTNMKNFLLENGFNCPLYYEVLPETFDPEKFAHLQYPVIVKPIDSSGSRGVTRVEKTGELEESINIALAASKSGKALIEEYIVNKYPFVVGGDILVLNKEVVFWGILNSLRDLSLNDHVPVGTSSPSYVPEDLLFSVKREIERAIGLLGVQNITLNIEVIIDENDDVYIIELNPRNGGNMIPELLYTAKDYDSYMCSIRMACGDLTKDQLILAEAGKFISTYVIHSEKSGILESIEYSEKLKAHLLEEHMTVKTGDLVEVFTDASKKIGIIFLEFSSMEQMREILDRINEEITIKQTSPADREEHEEWLKN